MKNVLDYQMKMGMNETADEIDHILESDPQVFAKLSTDGYGLYVDKKTNHAVFEDENEKILLDASKMPTYDIEWDENNGWVVNTSNLI